MVRQLFPLLGEVVRDSPIFLEVVRDDPTEEFPDGDDLRRDFVSLAGLPATLESEFPDGDHLRRDEPPPANPAHSDG